MPFLSWFRPALLLGLVATMSGGFAAEAADRSAKEILAEYKAVQNPQIKGKDRDDPEKLQTYRAAFKQASLQKSALIGELLRADPGNAELPKLIALRWRANLGTPQGDAATKAEVEEVLAKTDHPKLVVEAAYFQTWLALGNLGPEPKFDAMMPPILAFTKRFADDPRCATLLHRAAALIEDPSKKAEMLASIERDYPSSPEGRMQAADRQRATRLGKPFELEFVDAISGSTVSIKQLRGKVVVIDFWATWCGPCIAEMPRMKTLYSEYHSKGVEFIGISLDAPKEKGGLDKLKAYVAENKVDWPQYYQGNGWESDFSVSWGINAIPAMFMVDPEGNLSSLDARDNLEELLVKALTQVKKPL